MGQLSESIARIDKNDCNPGTRAFSDLIGHNSHRNTLVKERCSIWPFNIIVMGSVALTLHYILDAFQV